MTVQVRAPMPEWASVAEVAERFGVTTRMIRDAISRGDLRAHRIGPRNVRIHRDAVEGWAEPIEPTTREVA